MAANTIPIFPLTPSIQWGTTALATANTAKDGTGTVLTVFTADVTNGSRVDYIRVRAIGTNVATAFRVFMNNGSSNATPANNVLLTEATIAATTLSEVAALAETTIQLDVALPPGYKLNCAIGTTVAAGLMITAVGAHY
jgi:hypothetical protein